MILGLYRYDLPFRHPISSGNEIIESRSGILVRAGDAWGEVSPLPGESQESLEDALSDAKQYIESVADKEPIHPVEFESPSARFGIDCLRECIAYERSAETQFVKSYATLSGSPKTIIYEWLKCTGPSPDTVKLSVGKNGMKDELRLVKELTKRSADLKIILDAGCRWTKEEAWTFLSQVSKDNICYVQDACDNLKDISDVSEATGIPVALQRHVTSSSLPEWSLIPNLKAIVIKPSIVGLISECHALTAIAASMGLFTVFESAYESAVGILNIQNLALRRGVSRTYRHGLDTAGIFEKNVMKPDGVTVNTRVLSTICEINA